MVATTVVEPEQEVVPSPTSKKVPPKWHTPLFSKAFSFKLRSFLPGGGNFSLRSFSIAEAAFLLMMAFIASRGLGVVRQIIFNALFGTGPEANAYYAAARLPDALFDLVAGGAFTHAFIPVFLSYEKDHGQREAWRLASLVFNVLLVALTVLVLVGEFVAPTFVSRLLVPGYSPSVQALTTSLTRIMLIQPLILGLGTVLTAILNSKRQFLLPAFSIAVYNVGLIGGLLFSLAIPGVGIYGPTYGVIAAAACHGLVMIPALTKQGVRYTFTWNLKHPGLRDVLRLLGPNTLTVAIASTGFIIDTAFISYLPDKASLASARNAHLLFAFPVALIGQAIGLAALPYMATLAKSGRYLRLRITVMKLLGGALLLSIVASIMLYLLGKPTISLLFQHGAFNRHSSRVTGTALLGYALALPGAALIELLVLGFYAFKDARTPLFVNILGLVTRWSLLALLVRLLTGSHAILAVPLALTGAGLVEALLLGNLLYLRLRSKVRTDKAVQRLERRRNPDARIRTAEAEPVDDFVNGLEPFAHLVSEPSELSELILPEQSISELDGSTPTELLVNEPEDHERTENLVRDHEPEQQTSAEQTIIELEDQEPTDRLVSEPESQERTELLGSKLESQQPTDRLISTSGSHKRTDRLNHRPGSQKRQRRPRHEAKRKRH